MVALKVLSSGFRFSAATAIGLREPFSAYILALLLLENKLGTATLDSAATLDSEEDRFHIG